MMKLTVQQLAICCLQCILCLLLVDTIHGLEGNEADVLIVGAGMCMASKL